MRKVRKARWLSLLLSAVMLAGMTPNIGVAVDPVLDQNANSVDVILTVAPTQSYRDGTANYIVTVQNQAVAGANPAWVDLSLQLPAADGTASGAVVPIVSGLYLEVGESQTWTSADIPALSFPLSGINAGVVTARARVDYYALYDAEPDDYDAEGSKTIPIRVLSYAELGDFVWLDADRDGIQDAGELGVGGVIVNLRDGVTGDFITTTSTDGDGYYKFDDLKAGSYKVEFVSPAGYAFTMQNADLAGIAGAVNSDADATTGMTEAVALAAGESKLFVDAGLYMPVEQLNVTKTANTSYIRTHKWLIDKWVTTDNGKTEEFEEGTLPKIWLYVDGSGDESAHWNVKVDYDEYVDSGFNVSGDVTIYNAGDLDARITSVSDLMGAVPADVDFGVTFPYTLPAGETLIGSYDEDVDSKIDGPNVATVVTERATYTGSAAITWGDPTTEIDKTVNIEDVSSEFGTVDLGSVTAPNGDTFTYDGAYAWEDFDSAGPHFVRNTATIVETGQSASAALAINWVPPSAIGDFVWNDMNQDGIQGAGELGISGVTVNLYTCDGTPAGTTVTDADGYYLFDDLMAGDYKVEFVLPAGYAFSPQDQGADDAVDSDADVVTGMTMCTTLDAGETDLTWDAGMYIMRQETTETAWARMYDDPDDFTYKFDGHPWFSYLVMKPTTEKQTFYFYAAQHYKVGEVDIWRDNGNLRIEIRMDDGYTLYDSKVNVQTGLNKYPKTKWSPGQYPYTGGTEFSIPWSSGWNSKNLYIAVHGNILSYWD